LRLPFDASSGLVYPLVGLLVAAGLCRYRDRPPSPPGFAEMDWLPSQQDFFLRKWANSGFEGAPLGKLNKHDPRESSHRAAARRQVALKFNDNSEEMVVDSDDVIEDPAVLLDNILDSMSSHHNLST
jgi:hypothetical protein